eukprot:gene26448-30915_t
MTLATLLVVAISGIPSPSVYWSSSPTYGNETLLVAGAGFDSSGTSVEICQGKDYEDSHTWMGIVGTYVKITTPGSEAGTTSGSGSVVYVEINVPDIWWATSGNPGEMVPGTFQLDRNHPSWINATVVQGDTVRVFGRSLHWDADASETSTKCTSGTTLSYYSPGPTDAKEGAATAATTANPSTELTAGGVTVTTSAANCYEASFPTARIPAGTYTEAVLTTRWGKTSFGLTVLPARPKPAAAPAIINVQADFQGDLLKALAYATSLPTSQRKVLELGSTIYTLTTGTSLPVNTTVK